MPDHRIHISESDFVRVRLRPSQSFSESVFFRVVRVSFLFELAFVRVGLRPSRTRYNDSELYNAAGRLGRSPVERGKVITYLQMLARADSGSGRGRDERTGGDGRGGREGAGAVPVGKK
jgi:hypothetical protein